MGRKKEGKKPKKNTTDETQDVNERECFLKPNEHFLRTPEEKEAKAKDFAKSLQSIKSKRTNPVEMTNVSRERKYVPLLEMLENYESDDEEIADIYQPSTSGSQVSQMQQDCKKNLNQNETRNRSYNRSKSENTLYSNSNSRREDKQSKMNAQSKDSDLEKEFEKLLLGGNFSEDTKNYRSASEILRPLPDLPKNMHASFEPRSPTLPLYQIPYDRSEIAVFGVIKVCLDENSNLSPDSHSNQNPVLCEKVYSGSFGDKRHVVLHHENVSINMLVSKGNQVACRFLKYEEGDSEGDDQSWLNSVI